MICWMYNVHSGVVELLMSVLFPVKHGICFFLSGAASLLSSYPAYLWCLVCFLVWSKATNLLFAANGRQIRALSIPFVVHISTLFQRVALSSCGVCQQKQSFRYEAYVKVALLFVMFSYWVLIKSRNAPKSVWPRGLCKVWWMGPMISFWQQYQTTGISP